MIYSYHCAQNENQHWIVVLLIISLTSMLRSYSSEVPKEIEPESKREKGFDRTNILEECLDLPTKFEGSTELSNLQTE